MKTDVLTGRVLQEEELLYSIETAQIGKIDEVKDGVRSHFILQSIDLKLGHYNVSSIA